MKPKKIARKKIAAWIAMDDPPLAVVGDISGHIAVFFDKEDAEKWRKEMLGRRKGKVKKCLIELLK